jgi:hypothetical protein
MGLSRAGQQKQGHMTQHMRPLRCEVALHQDTTGKYPRPHTLPSPPPHPPKARPPLTRTHFASSGTSF